MTCSLPRLSITLGLLFGLIAGVPAYAQEPDQRQQQVEAIIHQAQQFAEVLPRLQEQEGALRSDMERLEDEHDKLSQELEPLNELSHAWKQRGKLLDEVNPSAARKQMRLLDRLSRLEIELLPNARKRLAKTERQVRDARNFIDQADSKIRKIIKS